MRNRLLGALVLVLLPAVPLCALAQSQYEASALRVRNSFWSMQLVAGADSHKICSLGSFPPRAPADLMRQQSADAADLYLTYRHKRTVGAILLWTGVAALTAAVLVGNPDNTERHRNTVVGLAVGAVVIDIVGIVKNVHARDCLSRAVWTYNGTLVGSGPTPAP